MTMKGVFLSFLLSVSSILCFSQRDSAIKYSEVVVVEGATKEQLYQKARAWFNDAFKSSKDVIQIQDKETGELAGKGIMTSTVIFKYLGERKYNASYNFSMKIFVKDGKYKYELTDFDNYEVAENKVTALGIITSAAECPVKWSMVSQKKMNEVWTSAKENLQLKIEPFLASLKKTMSASVSNNW